VWPKYDARSCSCLREKGNTHMQVVRDFLLHGPIEIGKKTYAHLTQYYLGIVTKIQQGHHSNLKALSVTQTIRSPKLQFNGCLLNQQTAAVCDIVHWGLTDYLLKRVAHDNNRVTNVSVFFQTAEHCSSACCFSRCF
jgi:hypothetical protein